MSRDLILGLNQLTQLLTSHPNRSEALTLPFGAQAQAIACQGRSSHLSLPWLVVTSENSRLSDGHSGVSFPPRPWSSHWSAPCAPLVFSKSKRSQVYPSPSARPALHACGSWAPRQASGSCPIYMPRWRVRWDDWLSYMYYWPKNEMMRYLPQANWACLSSYWYFQW